MQAIHELMSTINSMLEVFASLKIFVIILIGLKGRVGWKKVQVAKLKGI